MDAHTDIDETSRGSNGACRAQVNGVCTGLAGLILTAAMLIVAERGEPRADCGPQGEASAARG